MIVPRAIAGAASIRSGAGRHQAFDLRFEDIAALGRELQIADDFREAEHAHGDVGEADAVGQFRDIEGHATGAGFEVGTDHRQQQAGEHHGDGFEHRALCQHHREDEAEHHEREIFRRSEQQREAGQRRPERGHQHRRHAAREERADRGDRECGPRPALARHLVAVEAGDDGGGLTGDVDQNRGGRTAVLSAVINAGEHDQRADRRQAECDRQQHRDGRNRADAGQNADQGSHQRTEQTEQNVVRVGRDLKAQQEVREKVRHDLPTPISSSAARAGTAD